MAEQMKIVWLNNSRLRVSEKVFQALLAAGATYEDADDNRVAIPAELALIDAPSAEEAVLSKTRTADFFEPHLSPDLLVSRVNDFWQLLNERARELAGDYPFGEKPTAWDLLHAITASLEGVTAANDDMHEALRLLGFAKDCEQPLPQLAHGFYWVRHAEEAEWSLCQLTDAGLYFFSVVSAWQLVPNWHDGSLRFRGPLPDPVQLETFLLKHADEKLGLTPKGDADASNAG